MSVDLLCFGEAFEDLVFHGLPHLPRLGEELKTERFHRTFGGGAVITACAARRLGTHTRVASALGAEAARRLAAEGVSVRNLREEGEPVALSVALSTDTDRAFVTYEGIHPALEERLLRAIPEEGARHLHGALPPREPRRWAELFRQRRANGGTGSWDFGWNPFLIEDASGLRELLSSLDVLFVNEPEAALYSGTSDLADALDYFSSLLPTTVVKRGAKGCSWVRDGVEGARDALPVIAVDTTGAGDAFDGGFLHELLRSSPIERCIDRASQVGALSTRRPGGIDGLPHAEEIS